MALTKITRHIIKPNESYDTHNINSTGIITAISANFSGNVSIAGTLTYDDVTNVDSIGIISARSGINVLQGGINVTGVSTFADKVNADGGLEVSGGVLTANNNINTSAVRRKSHTNTRLEFPANNEISLQNSSGSILRVKDDRVGINSVTPRSELDVRGNAIVSGVSTFVSSATFTGETITFTGANYNALWNKSDSELEFADNAKATFGDGNDLEIYHDGSHSYIDDSGTGNLYLRSGTLSIQNLAGSKTSALFNSGGGQELYHNNSKKFETTDSGIDVTGHTETDTLNVSGISTFANTISIAETIEHTGDTNTSISFPSNDYIRLTTSSSSRLNVTPNGYILLGTNSEPSGGDAHARNARLFIQGRIGNTADSGRLNLQRGSAASNGSSIGSITFTDNSNNAYARIETIADAAPGANDFPGRIVFSTTPDGSASPTEKFRIADDGNITFTGPNNNFATIQYTTSFTKLDLRGNGIGDSKHYFIGYGAGHANANNFHIVNGTSDGNIVFRTGSSTTERLRITSNGKIGIGTDNPSVRLDVMGDINCNNNVFISSSHDSNNIDHIWHDDNSSFGTGGTWNFVSDSTKKATGNSAIQIGYLKSSGGGHFLNNVGIGTNNPTDLIHAKNNSVASTKIVVESTGTDSYPAFRVKNDARSYDLGIDGATDAFRVYDATASTERLRINSDGVIQLSNLASTYTSGTATRFSLYNDTNNHYGLHVGGSFDLNYNAGGSVLSGKGEHRFHTAAQERLRIDSDGNVGIGTNNPKRKLHVSSSGADSTILVTGTTPQIRLNSVTADGNDDDRAIFGLATANNHFVSGAVSGDAVLRTTNGGNLIFGEGTTERLRLASDGKLSIKGSTANMEYLRMGGNNDRGLRFTSSTGSSSVGVVHTINAPGDSGAQGEIVLQTNSAERLRITSDGKVRVPDNGKFIAGTGDDLQIYHSSNINRIEASQQLYLKGAGINFYKAASSELMASFIQDGAVELYHNNSKKFETTSAGIDVTGTINSTSHIIAGAYTGGVALTVNDGHGNANVTFNHASGSPDIVGNSLRIETNVDSTAGNPTMVFEGAVASSAGGSLSLSQLLRLRLTEGADFPGHVTTNAGNFIIGSDAYGITWDDSGDDAARVYADRANNSFNIDLNSANSSDITTFRIRTYNSMGQDYSDVLTYDTTFEKLSISEIEHNGQITIDANGGGADIRLEASDDIILNSGENAPDNGAIYFRGKNGANSYRFAKSGQTAIEGFLSFESLTQDRTFTFPNAGGTIALTSDISTNADTLDGQHGSYYQNASNLNAGTIPDARIPNVITPTTRVQTAELRANGTQLVLNAGEAAGKFSSQTAERIYLNSEQGVVVSTSAGNNNFQSGWFPRQTIIDGTGIHFYMGDSESPGTQTKMGEITSQDTVWLRINQTTAKNIYTPRYIRADGGFFVDGTAKGINGSGNFIGGTIAGASDYGTLLRSNEDDTASGNITFNGRVNIRGHIDLSDSEELCFGSSDDVKIRYLSSNWMYWNFVNGNGLVFQDNGSDKVILEDSGVFRPSGNNTGSIGTSSNRWANIWATKINFAAHSTDTANITTTVSGSSTYLDFNLTDDNNQEEFRWRFDPSGSSSVYNAMHLKPTANGESTLIVSGDIGIGAQPGGNLAGRAHCLAIGDSDTGIAQNGDGQFEIWANNQEICNFDTGEIHALKAMRVANDFRVATTNTFPGHNNNNGGFHVEDASQGTSMFCSRKDNTAAYFNRNNNGGLVSFRRGGNERGQVVMNTNSVSYNTTSDYRLKENVVVLDNAINRVKQLLPKRFNFIGDSEVLDGFLAHEAQVVVPESVSGTQDEVEIWKESEELPDGVSVGDNKLDDQGNTIPIYQGIDQAKLVPLVTAALQEAIAKIEALETQNANLLSRIEALE